MGSTGQAMPSQSMSRSASQNPGMAKPMNTSTVMARSNGPFCFQAESTPMGTARSRVRAREATFMPKVSGRRSSILSQTGRLSPDTDWPKSKVASRASQRAYCTCTGWSRP